MRVKLLALLGVAVAAGAAFGIYEWTSGSGSSVRAAASKCAPVPVPAAAKRVLAAYAGRIQHSVNSQADGSRDESWSDPVSGTTLQVSYDRRGRITDEFGTVRRGKVAVTTWLLYSGRTWMVERETVPGSAARPANEAAQVARLYRDEAARGTAKVLGRETVDGRTTLHLRQIQHLPAITPSAAMLPKGIHMPKSVQPAMNVRLDTWVDPLTYLPVRTSSDFAGHLTQTDETWLVRTPANLARTKLVIPPGFKQLHPAQGMGSGQLFMRIDKSKNCGP